MANLSEPLAGLVDTAMLGHQSSMALVPGVALGAIIFDFVYYSFGFLRLSTTGLAAQAIGQNDSAELAQVLYRALGLGLLLSLCILIFQKPIEAIGFAMQQGSVEVLQAGREYFQSRILGAPAVFCGFVLTGWFLGRGESGKVLIMTLVFNFTNVGLNYKFIMLDGLGAGGAGLGTMAAQYARLLVGLIFLICVQPGMPNFARLLQASRWRSIFAMNMNLMLRTILLLAAFAIFINFSNFDPMHGEAIMSANSVLFHVFVFAAFMVDGPAVALETLAGNFLGARNLSALKKSFRLALQLGLGIALVFSIPVIIAPEQCLFILNKHLAVQKVLLEAYPWVIVVLLGGTVAFILDGLFFGLTETKYLRNGMILSMLIFLPLIYGAYRLQNNDLLWLAMGIFMIVRSGTLYYFWHRMQKQYKQDWSQKASAEHDTSL